MRSCSASIAARPLSARSVASCLLRSSLAACTHTARFCGANSSYIPEKALSLQQWTGCVTGQTTFQWSRYCDTFYYWAGQTCCTWMWWARTRINADHQEKQRRHSHAGSMRKLRRHCNQSQINRRVTAFTASVAQRRCHPAFLAEPEPSPAAGCSGCGSPVPPPWRWPTPPARSPPLQPASALLCTSRQSAGIWDRANVAAIAADIRLPETSASREKELAMGSDMKTETLICSGYMQAVRTASHEQTCSTETPVTGSRWLCSAPCQSHETVRLI